MPLRTEPELATLLKRVAVASGLFDEERLMEAFETARECYHGQMHWTGETLLEHTVGILDVLSPFHPDEDAVIACLLHHVLEQKSMTLSEIEQKFGPKVRMLVSGIHLLSHVTLEGRRRSIEDLRVMLLSVSDDIRILFVALCDRAHCLTFVDQIEASRAKRLCQDVLQLFAPVAARLGMYSLKHRLEDGAFPVLYGHDCQQIKEQMQMANDEHPDFLQKAASALQSFLTEQGIIAEVQAREKHPYSLFLKMRQKSLTHVEDVYDLFALRVIVRTEEDCYRVLGLLHRLGRPLANRFKDYIAFPKPNGYQSLHTTLAAFAGIHESSFVEVQVRTEQMHREAQFGVAAHWSYKEHGATDQAMEKVQLHSMLMGQEPLETTDEEQSFVDHIFVLTPRGDIVELPEGATPLDFAFQVHTDLGLAFRNARVNGSIVPLDYQLENGDVVEILKHKTPQPSDQWMQLLKMASSRSKLRRYLLSQKRPEHVTRGRELVNVELKKRSLASLTTDLSILRICDGEKMTLEQREDLLVKIGQGSERASSLLPRLAALSSEEILLQKSTAPTVAVRDTGSRLVAMEGGVSMPVQYAKCCEPEQWPREDIVGNISRSGAVMVHRSHCRMFGNTNPDRRVKVWWR